MKAERLDLSKKTAVVLKSAVLVYRAKTRTIVSLPNKLWT